mgnify:CR=1 FL=1
MRTMVYDTATRFKDPKFLHHRKFFVSYMAQGKVNSSHMPIYLNFFKKRSCDKEINKEAFEKDCGIGVSYTDEQIAEVVNQVLDSKKDALDKSGWAFGYGPALGQIKKKIIFADSAKVVQALDDELTKRLGPRPSSEEVKKAAKKKAANKGQKKQKQQKAKPKEEELAYETLSDAVQFHDPKDNIQATPELLEEHLRITGGKVRTRFPPEPNVRCTVYMIMYLYLTGFPSYWTRQIHEFEFWLC